MLLTCGEESRRVRPARAKKYRGAERVTGSDLYSRNATAVLVTRFWRSGFGRPQNS